MHEKDKCGLFENPKLMSDKQIVATLDALYNRNTKNLNQIIHLRKEQDRRKIAEAMKDHQSWKRGLGIMQIDFGKE